MTKFPGNPPLLTGDIPDSDARSSPLGLNLRPSRPKRRSNPGNHAPLQVHTATRVGVAGQRQTIQRHRNPGAPQRPGGGIRGGVHPDL